MLSNLYLAYVHLRLEEIFGREQWFGGFNMLFVGDILQLPPVFDIITNKSVALKLGCMTSVNIWQDTVLYDDLTINERQKKDRAFSSMLDEVRCGCPTDENFQLLQERVMKAPVVDTFEQLLAAGLEAVLEIAVGARMMLPHNIDTSQGLVNGAVGTVISHHI